MRSPAAGRKLSKWRLTSSRLRISSSKEWAAKSPINRWPRGAFSMEGLKELDALYEQLLGNLQLAMSVFFSGDVPSARRLRRSKHRFRIMNRRYSHAHVDRLHQQNVQSIETSTLHLALLGDMKRLNSLFCSVAYSVMEQPDEDDERDEY